MGIQSGERRIGSRAEKVVPWSKGADAEPPVHGLLVELDQPPRFQRFAVGTERITFDGSST